MSLQSIMDATPIEWSRTSLGDYIGSGNEFSYLLSKDNTHYKLHYYKMFWEDTKFCVSKTHEPFIDKINELEGG